MDKTVDFIIVGDGFAAMFMAHRLHWAGKTFRIFSDGREGASKISAGVVNPVILKRFTVIPGAAEQILCLTETFEEIQKYTGENYLIHERVCRIFHDVNERQAWLKKSENPEVGQFLSKDFKTFPAIENPHGYGEVLRSCRLDVARFFSGLTTHFSALGYVINESLDYSKLQESTYGGLKFSNIIFCEGVHVAANPFFENIPVQPNKGHRLSVKFDKPLHTDSTLKKKYFLFPESCGQYFFGATYDRFAQNLEVETEQVQHLEESLAEMYKFPFQISGAKTGFRATVPDRKPILGRSEKHHNYFILNGLGARGVLNGCYYSKILFEFIENGVPLPAEVDLARFK